MSKLFETNIDAAPVGGIWNLTGKYIENFVSSYLAKNGVNGVTNVTLYVRNKGSNNARCSVYAFLSGNSNAISVGNKRRDIPEALESKVDFGAGARLTDDAKKIFAPITYQNPRFGKAGGSLKNEYFVELDIFNVVGLMLNVDNGYEIWINPIVERGNDVVVPVIKKVKTRYGNDNVSGDNHDKWVENMESRRYY